MQALKKLLFLSLCILLPFALAAPAEAARQQPVHTLNYFQSYATKDAWRVEIGVNASDVKYEIRQKTLLRKEIVIDFDDTVRGELKQHIAQKSDVVKDIRIDETPDHHTELHIALQPDFGEVEVRVTAIDADRRAHLPFRLAFDIYPKPAEPEAPSVDGVKGHTIVLDAGHGGSDTGAVGPSGVTEASVTLAVTQDLQRILEASGARTAMTRDTDVDVYGPNATDGQELQARVDVGERTSGAEVFLSIHCNAFSNANANGMETYYCAGSSRAARLATLLNEELSRAGGRRNRGVKTANFYVMRHSSMPASLVELAFVTNPAEEALLSDPDYQQQLAMALAIGLSRYFTER
ncbi:N-acetylmuramoyl-L-alanine amidase [Selenomonas sp.]|uniref:N-acetylmuramoyl-L-alanine amidase family protein n=1 Tax=Selenomonas sp. TaxID=2053611 RepID=UPI0025F635EC|nr:N-acetylmuramoyl-L-alanine amidase [Selenomonas sp.]MCI6284551.1 N-acetylmuramoyl-L-alanine amidase [Selenomonas sp.]